MKKLHGFIISAFACLLLVPVAGQEPVDSHALIRSDTRLILVDAVVTDKKGVYIRNLTIKDFKVYEDGKERNLSSFSSEAENSSDTSRKHHMVLFFDNSTTTLTELAYARQAATKFIETHVGPNRLTAIAEFGGALVITQDFTDNPELLKKAVAGARFPSIGPSAGGPAGPSVRDFSIRSAFAALRNVATGLSSVPGRKSLVFFSAGFPMTSETLFEMNKTLDICNRANVAIYPIDIRTITMSLGSLQQTTMLIPASFRSGPPPKEGHPPGTSGGGRTTSPSARPPSSRPARRGILPSVIPQIEGRRQSLYALAEGTGGFVIMNTNDLLGGLERIANEQNEYYVLGYVPDKADPGACHRLEVRVDREGAAVRTRTGYCEAKPLDLLSGTPAGRDLEAVLNRKFTPGPAGASMLAPFLYVDQNKARVNFVLDIPGSSIRFVKQNGRLESVLNVVGIARLPDGKVGARFSDTARWSFSDQNQVDAFEQKPVHYEKQFELAPAEYTLGVAFSSGPNQIGRLERPLHVEPWQLDQFTIGSLVLSKNLLPADGSVDFNTDLEDRVPLIVGDFQVVPAGSNHFKKSEKAFVYTEVYEPALVKLKLEDQDPPAVALSAQLLDPKTGELKKDLGTTHAKIPPFTGNPRIPVGLVVNAPELEAGVYRLRVSARDSAGHAVARSTAIELEE
jgi:VWFA-related protein